MADSQSLGEIVVSIIADTAKFDKGIKDVDKTLSNFDKSGKKASKNTEKLQQSINQTGTESKKASGNVKELDNQVENEGTNADKASGKNEKNAKSIKKVDDSASLAKKGVKFLMSTMAAVGVTVGVKQLVDKFVELDQKIRDANLSYQEYVKQMQTSVGTSAGMSARAKELYDQTYGYTPYDKEAISKAAAYVAKVYADTSEEIQTALMREFLAQNKIADTIGAGDITSSMNQYTTLAKKYAITDEELAENLAYLRATTQDSNISLSELESTMLLLEDYSKIMGLSFKQTADMIAAAADMGNLEDIADLGSAFTSAYATAMENLKKEILATEGNTLEGAELQKYVAEKVTEMFKNGIAEAMKSGDKFELGAYLNDKLGISAAKTTNLAAGLLSITNQEEVNRLNRENLITTEKQNELMGVTTKEVQTQLENMQDKNRQNEEYLQGLQKVTASELAVTTATENNLEGFVKGRLSEVERLNNETQKALETNEWSIETFLNEMANLMTGWNPMQGVVDTIFENIDQSIDSDVVNKILEDVNKQLSEIDPSDLESATKIIGDAVEELIKLGESTDIDVTEPINSLNLIYQALTGEDVGVIPALDKFSQQFTITAGYIDGTAIPANSRYEASLDKVIGKLKTVIDLKAKAGV